MPGSDPETTPPAPSPDAPHLHGPTQVESDRPVEPGPGAGPEPRRPAHPEPGERPVLPDVSSDERDVGWGDWPESGDDERYLREVPPHHGG